MVLTKSRDVQCRSCWRKTKHGDTNKWYAKKRYATNQCVAQHCTYLSSLCSSHYFFVEATGLQTCNANTQLGNPAHNPRLSTHSAIQHTIDSTIQHTIDLAIQHTIEIGKPAHNPCWSITLMSIYEHL